MAPGSFIVISHNHHEGDEDLVRQVMDIYRDASAPAHYRTRDQIAAFFDGFKLIDPGLVPLPDWRPEPRPYPAGEVWGLCGIGRKPGQTPAGAVEKTNVSVRRAADT
jgi:hypothetical protein